MKKNGAIETLREFVENSDNVIIKDAILKLHPELAESEDERIRKSLIKHFENYYEMYDKTCGEPKFGYDNLIVRDIISYLEKQKSANPFSGTGFDYDGHHYGMCARDNGVEVTKDGVIIYRSVPPFIGQNPMTEEHIANVFEKVGLAKIVREQGNDALTNAVQSAMIELSQQEKQKEQKPIINFPVFIEEKNIEQAIKKFLGESAKFQKEQTFTHHEIDESLQDAVTHQMEDDGDVDDFVRRGIDDIVLKYAEIGAKWQKEQKPAEWSEEDEKMRNKIIGCLSTLIYRNPLYEEDANECIAWLESLLSRPKPSDNWKPTKEQLDALLEAASEKEIDREDGNVLYQLYDQLKKL